MSIREMAATSGRRGSYTSVPGCCWLSQDLLSESIDKESVLCQLPNPQDNIADKQQRTAPPLPKLLRSSSVLLSLPRPELLIRKSNWAVQWSECGPIATWNGSEGNQKPWVVPKERVAISSFITKQTICFKSTSNAHPPGPTLLTFRVKAAYRRGLILLHKYEIIN